MTRLTLDTIALCGFGYRFNSFYRETPHPFVQAMVRTLEESQRRMRQLPIQTRLRIRAQRQSEEDDAFMNALVDQLIAERRAQGEEADTTDLLGRMLTGVDKQSGEGLPDENIRAQCITFLVAGHETTSGLLSFAIYYLLKNPEYSTRARAEIDCAGQRRTLRSSRCTSSPTSRQVLERVAPAVADRSHVHAPSTRGHGDRRQVRPPRGHSSHRARAGAAQGPVDLGGRCAGVPPRAHGA